MNKGKWYLVYTWLNTFEPRGGEREDKEIPLDATTEVDAIHEGRAKWAEVLAEASANWEKQKATYVHPPTTAFQGATPNPRIIYRIPL